MLGCLHVGCHPCFVWDVYVRLFVCWEPSVIIMTVYIADLAGQIVKFESISMKIVVVDEGKLWS